MCLLFLLTIMPTLPAHTFTHSYLHGESFQASLFVVHLCSNLCQLMFEPFHTLLGQVNISLEEVRVVLGAPNTWIGVYWNTEKSHNKKHTFYLICLKVQCHVVAIINPLLIISLELFQTGVIFLHAHPQIVYTFIYCNCVKFHHYRFIH